MPCIPGQNEINLDIAGWYDDEGNEEDLSIEESVVQVSPLLGGEATHDQLGVVGLQDRGGQVLKEVFSGALVEILSGVFLHTEYDGLGTGEQHGQDPGQDHHQPGPGPLPHYVQGEEGPTNAYIPAKYKYGLF